MNVLETNGKVVEGRIGVRPVRFFVANPNDEIQKHHAAGTFYETEQLEAMAKFVDPRRVFLDVGANVGNHTLYASLILDVAKTVPFEVDPTALAVLDINLALNRCATVDTAYLGFGAASADGLLEATFREADNIGGTRFASAATGTFSSICLDGVVGHLPVGFIKIDVEGMEMDVIAGLRETIGRGRPAMFLEIEDRQMPDFELWNRAFEYRVQATFVRYRGKKEYLLLPPTT